MALTSRDQFVDDDGDLFVVEAVHHGDGDVDYFLSTPQRGRFKVRRLHPHTGNPVNPRRPVDADAPLPLENL